MFLITKIFLYFSILTPQYSLHIVLLFYLFFIIFLLTRYISLLVYFFLLAYFSFLFFYPMFSVSKHNFNLNIVLTNKLMLSHPLFLFIVFFIFCRLIKSNFYYINTTVLYIYLICLILGMYWANQEVLWGGWWNWDLTEFSLLFLGIWLLYLYHKQFNINMFII